MGLGHPVGLCEASAAVAVHQPARGTRLVQTHVGAVGRQVPAIHIKIIDVYPVMSLYSPSIHEGAQLATMALPFHPWVAVRTST